MIRARSVEKRYGHARALRAVSFDVARHECLVVTGPNGSGKTTLLRLLAGLAAPTRGELEVDADRSHVGYLGHEPLIYRDRNMKLEPALALSWKTVNPTTWEFKLRQGVVFHDGTKFTSDDVVFSFQRAARGGILVGGILVGSACGTVAEPSCLPIPPGVARLVADLRALDQQQLRDATCSQLR